MRRKRGKHREFRVGVYFGSFDPVHENHIGLAKHALTRLDCVYIVVNPNQPSKPLLSSLRDRAALVDARLACEDCQRIHRYPARQEVNAWGRKALCQQICKAVRSLHPSSLRVDVKMYQMIGQDSFERVCHLGGISKGLRSSMAGRTVLVFPRNVSPSPVVVPSAMGGVDVEVVTDYVDPHQGLSSTTLRIAAFSCEVINPPQGLHSSVWREAIARSLYVPLLPSSDKLHVAVLGAPGSGKTATCEEVERQIGTSSLRFVSGGEFHRTATIILGSEYSLGLKARCKNTPNGALNNARYRNEQERFICGCHSAAMRAFAASGALPAVLTDVRDLRQIEVLEMNHLSELEDSCKPISYDIVICLEVPREVVLDRLRVRGHRVGDSGNPRGRLDRYLADSGERARSLTEYAARHPQTSIVKLDGGKPFAAVCDGVVQALREAACRKSIVMPAGDSANDIVHSRDVGVPADPESMASPNTPDRIYAETQLAVERAWSAGGFGR